ncbi:6-phosphogluconolactonase [Georgenia subflava]|uniref:Glucosamine-6-phosphate deaminase n=1 Tax=Georgenia subflava TaxID=1622177 RepID=A0A6N7EHI5_9MICO|nr:6-phosphogluconolactonase [Georgenia subflava]MPV36448.1 glucosamine-6-phosphate deaminase [Georgenia subflava]
MAVTEHESLTGAVTVAATAEEVGAAAADAAAQVLARAVESRGSARVIFASAPSQETMIRALARDPRVDWSAVRSFHMDEYRGLPEDHPEAFGQWLQDRLPAAALPGLNRIRTSGAAAEEVARYSALVSEAPIDLVCLGLGVNGHIAFNEPDVARFDDDQVVREVEVTEVSRRQQVDDGLFPTLADVPARALTLTVPALTGAGAMVATVLGAHKADAVAAALTGPVSTRVPGSVLRTHPAASMFLDVAAASRLGKDVDGA